MFVPDKQVGIVKSSAHNNNIKNIRFDLNHLFMAVERMDAVVRDHYRLQQSALRDIKARLDRVNLQLEAARIMVQINTDLYGMKVLITIPDSNATIPNRFPNACCAMRQLPENLRCRLSPNTRDLLVPLVFQRLKAVYYAAMNML